MSSTISSFTLSLSSNDWRRTKFYHPCGDVLYWIDTAIQQGLCTPPTSIYRRKAGDNGWDLVARIEFPTLGSNRIIYNKEELYLDAMFPHKGLLNSSIQFNSGRGIWNWVKSSSGIQLQDATTKESLVQYHKNFSHDTRTHEPTLDIGDKALPFLDLVIAGWVVFRRHLERTSRGNGC